MDPHNAMLPIRNNFVFGSSAWIPLLGNDIGRAKSPEDDIPHELKLKNLQITDLLKPILLPILPYYDLHWDMLRFVRCGYL